MEALAPCFYPFLFRFFIFFRCSEILLMNINRHPNPRFTSRIFRLLNNLNSCADDVTVSSTCDRAVKNQYE